MIPLIKVAGRSFQIAYDKSGWHFPLGPYPAPNASMFNRPRPDLPTDELKRELEDEIAHCAILGGWKLQIGDIFDVDVGDGRMFEFEVLSTDMGPELDCVSEYVSPQYAEKEQAATQSRPAHKVKVDLSDNPAGLSKEQTDAQIQKAVDKGEIEIRRKLREWPVGKKMEHRYNAGTGEVEFNFVDDAKAPLVFMAKARQLLTKTANPAIKDRVMKLTKQEFDRLSVQHVSRIAQVFGQSGKILGKEDREWLWEFIQDEKAKLPLPKVIPAPIEFGLPPETQPPENLPERSPAEPADSELVPDSVEEELRRLREEVETRKEIKRLKEENKRLEQNEKRRKSRKLVTAYGPRWPWRKTVPVEQKQDDFVNYANGEFSANVRIRVGGHQTNWNSFANPHAAVEFAREQASLVVNDEVELKMSWRNEGAGTFAEVVFAAKNGSRLEKRGERYGNLGASKTAARSLWDDDETIIPESRLKTTKPAVSFEEEAARLRGLGKQDKKVEQRPAPEAKTTFVDHGVKNETVHPETTADEDRTGIEAEEAAEAVVRKFKHAFPDEKTVWLMTDVSGWYPGSVPRIDAPGGGTIGFPSAPSGQIGGEADYRRMWLEPFRARLRMHGLESEEHSGKAKVDKWATTIPLAKTASTTWMVEWASWKHNSKPRLQTPSEIGDWVAVNWPGEKPTDEDYESSLTVSINRDESRSHPHVIKNAPRPWPEVTPDYSGGPHAEPATWKNWFLGRDMQKHVGDFAEGMRQALEAFLGENPGIADEGDRFIVNHPGGEVFQWIVGQNSGLTKTGGK